MLNEFQIFAARNSKSQQEFAKQLNLKYIERWGRGRYCINRLINKKCVMFTPQGLNRCLCQMRPDGFGIDHPFAFRYRTDPPLPFACFVWFPYGLNDAWCGDPISRLAKWCATHDLQFKTFDKDMGWYGYGSYMVVVWREWNLK